MVVLEAYATGTPVIASRIGSLAEVVDEGVTGILVEAGSAPSIVRAIDLATSDPEAIAVTGTAARRLYEERYRGARHLGTLMALYGSVVGTRPSPWPRSG
jgi:glycosyltransferase involved in cell wall biosynthesis